MAAQRLVRRAPIGENVVEAILDLVRAARPGEGDAEITKAISWGPGPRAAQALTLAARARALIDGRLAPVARRRRRARRAGAQASHGADVRRARRRRDDPRRGRAARRQIRALTRWRRTRAAPRPSRRTRRNARGAPAQPRHRRAPDRAKRDARRAWAPAGGTRRDLLAVPPVRLGRAGRARRLAPVGARKPRLRARARMGGGADAVDLDRPLALRCASARDWRRAPSSTARSCWRSRSPILRCAAANASACSGFRARSPRAASSTASPRSSRPPSASPPRPLAACGARSVALEDRADRRFPFARRRGRARVRRRRRGGRDRARGRDRRPDRGDLPLRRPHRISSRRAMSVVYARRARKICATAISRGSPPIARPCAPRRRAAAGTSSGTAPTSRRPRRCLRSRRGSPRARPTRS